MGNLIECLGYRIRAGDTELENHLKLARKMQATFRRLPKMS